MTRIPETTIQAIIDKSDIVAIVGEHVRLVRSGKEYKGLCPFHSEKTASFYVVPEKNIFYCFGSDIVELCSAGSRFLGYFYFIDSWGK